jgi:hypothetical protein
MTAMKTYAAELQVYKLRRESGKAGARNAPKPHKTICPAEGALDQVAQAGGVAAIVPAELTKVARAHARAWIP